MLRTTLASVLFAQILAVCAPQAQAETATPSQDAVEMVCGQIMGLWSGQLYYPRCREAVNSMLGARARQAQMAAAYADCREQELRGNALSACMLASEAKGQAPEPMKIAYPGGPDTEPGRRFDDTSSATQAARERYACTQLGFVPGTGAFEGCANALHEAVLPNTW